MTKQKLLPAPQWLSSAASGRLWDAEERRLLTSVAFWAQDELLQLLDSGAAGDLQEAAEMRRDNGHGRPA